MVGSRRSITGEATGAAVFCAFPHCCLASCPSTPTRPPVRIARSAPPPPPAPDGSVYDMGEYGLRPPLTVPRLTHEGETVLARLRVGRPHAEVLPADTCAPARTSADRRLQGPTLLSRPGGAAIPRSRRPALQLRRPRRDAVPSYFRPSSAPEGCTGGADDCLWPDSDTSRGTLHIFLRKFSKIGFLEIIIYRLFSLIYRDLSAFFTFSHFGL